MAPEKRIDKRLGEILTQNDIISTEELERALQVQKTDGGLLGEVLVRLRYLGEEDIVKALNMQYGFAYLPLESYDIKEDIVRKIPEHLARHYSAIAVDIIGEIMTVAMANPLNAKAIEDIETVTGKTVKVFITQSSSVQNAIGKFYEKEESSGSPQ